MNGLLRFKCFTNWNSLYVHPHSGFISLGRKELVLAHVWFLEEVVGVRVSFPSSIPPTVVMEESCLFCG